MHESTHRTLKPHQQCGNKMEPNDRSRNRRTPELPFIAGPSHFTWKNTRFRAPTTRTSQNEAHAISMQPLQCVLPTHVANPHLSSTQQHNMATLSIQLHGDLQPQISKHLITAHARIYPQNLEATPAMREQNGTKRSEPQRPPAGATLHVPKLSPKTKPMQHPCNIHGTSMEPLQCGLQPHVANPQLSTHMATQHGNFHAVIPRRSATKDPTTA